MSESKSWHPQPRVYDVRPKTAQIATAAAVKGETRPRRHVEALDGLKTVPAPGCRTVHDILTRSALTFGNGKALGSRRLIKTHEEVKKIKKNDGQEVDKKWQYFELGPYEYLTYIQFEKLALQCGAGLRKLGLVKEDRVHMYASTSQSWQAVAHGALSQSMPLVTTYDTLGEEGLVHAINQNKPRAMFVDPQMLQSVKTPLGSAPDMKAVIYNAERDVKKSDLEDLQSAFPDIQFISFDELRSLGEASPVATEPPRPEDICCIMYTSGSTGQPKGVVLKHRNVVAAIAGVNVIDGPYFGPGDRMLTYLPLAHIIEFMFENACLFWGATMGYGNPRTISDTSVRNCKGDIREFRPTILVGVPFIWETIKKGILKKIGSSGPVVKTLFKASLSMKSTMLWSNEWIPGTAVLDAAIFSKVRDATGGKLRLCLNGGGPIARDTRRFLSLVLCPMINGYGLTETAGMGGLTDPAYYTDDAIGPMPASIEMKLVDAPDFGYFSANDPPQGEIWIRGPALSEGYLDNEEETKKAYTDDGWFKTGDIGEFDHAGNIKVIDRKKNLVKTLNGEYIALEKLETLYSSSSIISSICVYASQDQQRPVAMVVPAEQALRDLASANGLAAANSLEEMAGDRKLRPLVLRELQNTGKKAGLAGFELLTAVILADEDWTPQNGLKTSTQKLNRRAIVSKYENDITQAYKGT